MMSESFESTPTTILSAAHDLFLRRGYSGTSMRAIAKEAGIALGGIYNHFDSKEDIFREVILAYHPYHEILPVLSAGHYETIEDYFRNAARLIDAALSQRPELLNLMFIEMVEFDSRHMPELLQHIFPHVSRTLEQLSAAHDRLRPMATPMVMRIFIGTFLGCFLTRKAMGPAAPPGFSENDLEHFMDVFLHGILKAEPEP